MILNMYIGNRDCPYCYSIATHIMRVRRDANSMRLYSKVFKAVRTYTIGCDKMIKFNTKEV